MGTVPAFLVVDDNPDGRSLVTRSLHRKFPNCSVAECDQVETALALLAANRYDAVLSHRTVEVRGADLVRLLRDVRPDVPIVMISGVDQSNEATVAGAKRFVHFDAWLIIGSVTAQLLAPRAIKAVDEMLG